MTDWTLERAARPTITEDELEALRVRAEQHLARDDGREWIMEMFVDARLVLALISAVTE